MPESSVEFDPDFAAPSEWAAMYRGCGLQVVPAKAPIKGGEWKMPALASWTEFQENLIPQATFDRWYGAGGNHANRLNMGILTGRCSNNVFVIDLDDQKGPQAGEWWHGLLEIHHSGIDPETVEQRTGGGGRQKLFRAPMDWVAPTNKTSLHIDIRGQGGFAMTPPSRHESGRYYEWMPGRAPWEIPIADAPEWLLEEIEKLVEAHGGVSHGGRTRTLSPGGDVNAFGGHEDGREEYMTKLVWAAVIGFRRDSPIPPGANEREAVWLDYERNTRSRIPDDGRTNTERLEEEGRGPSLFANKWRRAVRKWDGTIKEAADQPRPKPDEPDFEQESAKAEEQAKTNPANLFEFLDVRQIKAQPDPVWMIDELINEKSLGFIFGPPGSLKTFLALDIALSTTAKLASWWGRKINRHGAVIYLCREGVASLKFRIMAWEKHRQAPADDAPFYLIRKTINFMNPQDVGVLLATVEAIAAKAGVPIAAVFVDTVSRVLPGAKENQQEDMSLFVTACEAVQQRFDCVVIGVHHTNKSGGIRGSTVIPGAGDFLIETRREPGAQKGSIVLQKIKDGEDGQEFPFRVVKVELGGIVPRSSLMVDPDEDPGRVEVKGDDLPDISVCREILSALAMAWFNQMPWGSADNSSRPAVRLIVARWGLKRIAVKRLLDGWMANGIIEYEVYDLKNRLSGYRKVIDL